MFLPASSMTLVLIADILSLWLIPSLGVGDWFLTFTLLLGAHIVLCIIAMRLLMKFFPIMEGEFEMGSREAGYWQAQAVVALLGCNYFAPAIPLFLKPHWYRLFGAKIGKGVGIGGVLVDSSLTVLEAGSGVGADAMILGHWIAAGRVRIGRVVVGEGATIGAKALILPGVRLGAGATVGAMSMARSGQAVPPGEVWVGIPAKKLERTPALP